MKIVLTTDQFESGDFSDFLSCLAGCDTYDGKQIAVRISEAAGVKHALLVSCDDGGWDIWDDRLSAAAERLENEYGDRADHWLYDVGQDADAFQLVIREKDNPMYSGSGAFIREHTIVPDSDVAMWCENYIETQINAGATLKTA